MKVKLKNMEAIGQILDLNELEVYDVRIIGNKVYYYVQSKKEAGVCPECGEITEEIKEYKEYTIRDMPSHGKIVYLVITKKRFKCDCCNATFTEAYECIHEGEIYTNRYMEYIYKLCKINTIQDVSRLEDLGYKAIQRIFYIYAKKEVLTIDEGGHEVICIDETSLKKRHRQYVLVIYSPISGKIIDILEDRTKERLKEWLKNYKYKDDIKIVSIDMWEQYKDAVLEILPGVVVNADRFHVMKNLNNSLTKARRELQKDIDEETKELIKGSRWILVKNEENLSDEEKEKLKKNI
jgi:transposase